jgi:hypothetical protein
MLKMQSMILAIGLTLSINPHQAIALPGQTVEETAAWIQAHPTLRPASGETLLIRKSDTAAQRFTFEASILPPGRAAAGSGGVIRTEQISFFDVINGVSRDRLEEALRTIYGLEVYQDYAQAISIYQYPSPETLIQAQNQNAPLLAALQGEIREGNRYAYWLEIAQTRDGVAYTGQISVFLRNDIEILEAELRDR